MHELQHSGDVAVWWETGALQIRARALEGATQEVVTCRTFEEVVRAIQTTPELSPTDIACAAAYGLALFTLREAQNHASTEGGDWGDMVALLPTAKRALDSARPSEPFLAETTSRIVKSADDWGFTNYAPPVNYISGDCIAGHVMWEAHQTWASAHPEAVRATPKVAPLPPLSLGGTSARMSPDLNFGPLAHLVKPRSRGNAIVTILMLAWTVFLWIGLVGWVLPDLLTEMAANLESTGIPGTFAPVTCQQYFDSQGPLGTKCVGSFVSELWEKARTVELVQAPFAGYPPGTSVPARLLDDTAYPVTFTAFSEALVLALLLLFTALGMTVAAYHMLMDL